MFAVDDLPVPPYAQLLGWRPLDARPQEGWIKVAFDGKQELCNRAGFVQGAFSPLCSIPRWRLLPS